MSVKLEDNSIKVKAALDDAVISALYLAGGEMEAQVKRNVPPGNWYSNQKNAWVYKVDESKGEVTIGNPLEPSLWTEYGTGEFSIAPKGGRKGYWIYVKESGSVGSSYAYKGGKQYSLADAKKIVAMMREDGLDAHYTKGQKPHRPLQKAFSQHKNSIIRIIENAIKRGMS